MSEINAIATNNYILHNIDAKKLYVQEPLFTANSGDAVYVGWRPDETVLWTNSNPSQVSANVTLTGTLSESCSAFEKLRFICKGSYDYNESFNASVQAQEFYTNESNYENRVGVYLANRHGNTIYRDTCQLTFKGTGFTASVGSRIQGLTAMSENTARGPYILQVIGINRKENA